MRANELETAAQVHAESLKDPEYRAEWERTQIAHAVAMRILDYRIQNGLTQSELATRLGMRQPHVARLEAGEHEPSLATLSRIARTLGLSFQIEVTPERLAISA